MLTAPAARAAAARLALAAVLMALVACSPSTGGSEADAGVTTASSLPAPEPATVPAVTLDAEPAPAATAAPAPAEEITFAVVGDSLSLGDSPDFEHGVVGSLSWVSFAEGDGVEFVGGTAVVGAPSWTQLERARWLPEEALDADVLVMALGTNDMSAQRGMDATIDALEAIADLFADADRVLVLAVPPRTFEITPTTAEFNAELQNLAAERDWKFVDAPAPVRDGDGWAAGMTGDGIHYSRAAIPLVGEYVGEALRGER